MGVPPPSPHQKLKFFIYGATNNNSDYNFKMEVSLPPPPPKVKFFINGAILLKFETKHFHRLTNNN